VLEGEQNLSFAPWTASPLPTLGYGPQLFFDQEPLNRPFLFQSLSVYRRRWRIDPVLDLDVFLFFFLSVLSWSGLDKVLTLVR